MSKRKQAVLALVLIVTMCAITGCTTYDNFKEAFFNEKGAAADTVRIGILEPQTGNDSNMGQLEVQGIELAKELVPEILGKEVELVYGDTQSSIYVAESAAADLIAKKPAVVLGSYGDAASLTASQKLGKVKIPAITITATNPLITANNEYYFRMAFTDDSQGKALAEYVFNSLKLQDAAIIRTAGEESQTAMVSAFSKRLMKLTGNENCIKATADIDKEAKDFKPYIKEIWESGAKAVFMPVSLKSAEKIFEQAEKMSMNDVMFIGPKEWHGGKMIALQKKFPNLKFAVASDVASKEPQVWNMPNMPAEKADSTTAGTGDTEPGADTGTDTSTGTGIVLTTGLYDRFIKAYQDKYGRNDPPEATALAFDAYMIAAAAIEKAGSIDGYLIKDALKTTSNFEGVSGVISFDETGEPKKTVNVDVIQNGKFVSVYTIE